MNSIVQNVLFYSPGVFRNAIVSLYGISVYNQRYRYPWSDTLKYLLVSQHYSAEKLYNLQLHRLKSLFTHAVNHVPYYKKYEKFNLNGNIADILNRIEIIESEQLINSSESLLSNYYKKKDRLKLFTSGSSGTPKTIYISKSARRMNYAFYERSKIWAGITGFKKSVTFAGRTFIHPDRDKPPFWVYNAALNNYIFSSYHISETTIPYYIEKLIKINPILIDSYPSSLIKIAEYMIEKGINSIRPKAIITSSETLLSHHRDLIEKAFQAKIFDQYGNTEQSAYITQCKNGSYHLNPEYGILEIVDSKDRPVKAGEVGEFICTGFTNKAMPLLRYRIGDRGSFSTKKCSCGSEFPVIEKIEGRIDDLLISMDGKYIGRLDPVFKGLNSSIIESQIVQKSLDKLEIRIVKNNRYDIKHGIAIITELKKRLGPEINCTISYLDSIPRTSNGKFRSVIREFKIR